MPAPLAVLVEPADPGARRPARAVAHRPASEIVGHAWIDDRGLRLRVDLIRPSDRVDVAIALVRALTDATGAPVARWFVTGAQPDDAALAERLGLVATRELWQMRVPLPLPDAVAARSPATWRPFEPGRDEEAWLRVNNRSFADHRDQGNQTLDHLQALERAPWFDPEGFLLHEQDGRVDGFCWTKVHAETDPPLGEIYVIGVDPDAHGRGLGEALVRAGLAHLHTAGLSEGMLYVDADNDPAVRLYERLGFVTVSRDVEYTAADQPVETPTAEPTR